MKKQWKLTDLDCAACAAKMEEAIRRIPGVTGANVNFITQRMTVDADDARFDEITREIVRVCKRIEPDCVIGK
ncbi:MAG: cation transporter, partial [Oscillospiraceae bacterium]